jgi:hypothetical protein
MLRSAVVPWCLVLAAIPVAARAAAPLPQQQVDRIFAQWNQATPGCAVGIAVPAPRSRQGCGPERGGRPGVGYAL